MSIKCTHTKSGRMCKTCANKSRSEKLRGRRVENKIIKDNGSWVEIDISTKKKRGFTMKIDTEDYHSILTDCGRVSVNSCGYPQCRHNNSCNLVHIILFGHEGVVDHINHDKTDNRRKNLRRVSQSENMINRSGLQSNNTSGHTGVVWDRLKNKWLAQIKVNGRNIQLGRFKEKELAISARKDAEEIYHKIDPKSVYEDLRI